MMDFLILDDIPTPWREPVYERVYNVLGGVVQVAYLKHTEKRRLWAFDMGSHPRTYLGAVTLGLGGEERFFNPGIFSFLATQRPRVALVFASTKNPTVWCALGLCRSLGTKIALLSDTWLGRDRQIAAHQRWARRAVFRRFGDAFVAASRQTVVMFKHYNPRIRDEQCFLSHLVADNDHFERQLLAAPATRRFDVMFAGRIVEGKNPVFFAEACAAVKRRRGACSALIIGEGSDDLKARMRRVFEDGGVSYEFAGFIPHAALPRYYAQARLMLMPTSADCWGVVINEAMLAGTPVVTTEWTAAAGELVLHNLNGLVLPLDVEAWATEASGLLENTARWSAFSESAARKVKEFSYDRAAAGILDAFAYLKSGPSQPGPSDAR